MNNNFYARNIHKLTHWAGYSDGTILLDLTLRTGLLLRQCMNFVRSLLKAFRVKLNGAKFQLFNSLTSHLVDTNFLEICAAQVTQNSVDFLSQFLKQITGDENLSTLAADRVYGTFICRQAVSNHNPQTGISHGENIQIWKAEIILVKTRSEAIFACRRLGILIGKIKSDFHGINLVEAKIHCLKRLKKWLVPRALDEKCCSCASVPLFSSAPEKWGDQTSSHNQLCPNLSGAWRNYPKPNL